MNFINKYVNESISILQMLDHKDIYRLIERLYATKLNKGRLFILGVGGSAGTASHATNDFRKICEMEAFCATDNASLLTALINDSGWDTCYLEWLKGLNIKTGDSVLILSVGGGNIEKNVSMNLVKAIDYAKEHGAWVFGITGKDGGYTGQKADCCIIIPPLTSERITPHTEGLASVILHLIVSHPLLKTKQTKWESTK